MPRRGKRRRIGIGIYGDSSGISGVVTVDGEKLERRFPPGTDLDTIRLWRIDAAAKLRKRAPLGRKGTLAGDGKAYLAQVSHLASLKARRIEVNAWIAALGADTLRDKVKREHVLTARVNWLASGSKPKTINNRLETLRHWWRTLDGDDADTPCDGIKPLPVEKTPPVYISADMAQRVDAGLQRLEQAGKINAKTRARFRVLATTGKRPSELMRAQPQDINIKRRVWIVRDGKGGQSPGLYLNHDMLDAWQLFIAAEAWGTYHTSVLARTLRACGWPSGVRVYNLRHTTWITASERGVDLADVQAGAGHKNMATTRRHYVPVLSSRMQRLSESLDHRFQWAGSPPAVPPAHRRNEKKSEQMRIVRGEAVQLLTPEQMWKFGRK